MTIHANPQINADRFIDDVKKLIYGAACIGIVYGTRACTDEDILAELDQTPEGEKASAVLNNAVGDLTRAAVSLASRAYTMFYRVKMNHQHDENPTEGENQTVQTRLV